MPSDVSPANEKTTWQHEALAKVKVKVFQCSSSAITSVSFCRDDTCFVCSCEDGSVQLWDIEDGIIVQRFVDHKDRATQCKASTDGKFLVSTSWDKEIVLWDTATSKKVWSNKHVGIATCCSLSMDGKFAISGSDLDNSLSIWSTHDGKLIKKLKCFGGTVLSCSFSRNAYRFCVSSMDGRVGVIDMRNYCDEIEPKRLLTTSGHSNVVSNADFSHDDRLLAVASWDKSISVWDVNAGTYRNSGATYLLRGHEGSISACRFSADGSTLISSSYDTTLSVWDAKHLFKKFSLQGHRDWVTDCDVSNDHSWVISSSKDKTVKLWNISSADQIPIVIQNRKTIGLNVFKCDTCSEQFSTAQSYDHELATTCVFCRLKRPSEVYSFGN